MILELLGVKKPVKKRRWFGFEEISSRFFTPNLVCVAAGSRVIVVVVFFFLRESREMLGKLLRESAAKTLPPLPPYHPFSLFPISYLFDSCYAV